MKIDITTNFPEVQRKIQTLRADISSRVTASALNRTVEQARTQMTREITAEYNVTAAYVRERLTVRRASFRQGAFEMRAELSGGSNRGRAANLIRFVEKSVSLAQVRKRAKAGNLEQLRFQIRRAGGKKVITGAFIANKGRTVFIRTTDKRLPIKALQTIDVAQMFNQRRINERVVALIRTKFPELFARDLKYYLERFRG
jgi:hypothetical protein